MMKFLQQNPHRVCTDGFDYNNIFIDIDGKLKSQQSPNRIINVYDNAIKSWDVPPITFKVKPFIGPTL